MERSLMKGNEGLAEASIRACCKSFFGYHITPQSELAAYMAKRMEKAGGVFLQAESEIAAVNMVLGAASTGVRAMTSSSSPGVSLKAEGISYHAKTAVAKPRVLIPVFPGTNCEFDSAKAVERAGAEANIFVINNLSAAGIADSIDRFAKEVKQAQTIFIPGGFSGGDEPDGSGKFITAFFRNPAVREQVTELLERRDG